MTRVRSSATITANQIPFMPRIIGRISTAATWNTRVRRKEIAADIPPLLSAVKKDEPKILKPLNRYTRQ